MTENAIADAQDDRFERENVEICASLWERLSKTPYTVITDPHEEPEVMLLGDIEGLQKYVTNTFDGISAVLDEESMEGFNYEARYSMGHYLLDRFMENLDAAPLDEAHMAQLEQLNLVEQLGQPHFRDVVQQMQHIARNAYESPINPITEDDVVGALYQRGEQIMAAYGQLAEQKNSDLVGKLSDAYYEALNKMILEVANSASDLYKEINPNDLLRCIWHVVDDAYVAHQYGATAEQFYEECNIETPYFRQMLGFARVSSAFNAKMIEKAVHSTDTALESENSELIQAAWQDIDHHIFAVTDSETGEQTQLPLTKVSELNPYLNQLSTALYNTLNVQCSHMEVSARGKLVTHYIDEFLDDTEAFLGDETINADTIKKLNSTQIELTDLELYADIFQKMYGSFEITSDSPEHTRYEQLMIRCGEVLAVIDEHAAESTSLKPIPAERREFLDDILSQLAEEIASNEAYNEIEMGPVVTLVWDLIEEAMYTDLSAPDFFNQHNIDSEWMKQELQNALDRSEQMQLDQEEDAATALVPKTHFGYRLKKRQSLIPADEKTAISSRTSVWADISEGLRYEAVDKMATRDLKPAILSFRNEMAQSHIKAVADDGMQHVLDPAIILGDDFNRVYRLMQKALDEKSANMSQVHPSLSLTNAYVNMFLQNRFRRICDMCELGDIPEAYRQSITRDLAGNPSKFEQMVGLAYKIGALRFGPIPFGREGKDGKVEWFEPITHRPEVQEMVDKIHGTLSDTASRYGRLGQVMSIIDDHAELLFDMVSYSQEPAKELSTKMPIVRDLAERLDIPPEPYREMTSGAAVEILINAFGDAVDPEVNAESMRDQYDFSNTAYFDSRMKSNPTLQTRMIENSGRITAQKGAPYVH